MVSRRWNNGNVAARSERRDMHVDPVARHTPSTRDAALRRLAHCNRWLIAGAAALTGAITAVAANAFPGRSVKAAGQTARARAGAAPSTSAQQPGGSSGTQVPPLQRPEQEPQASPGSESGAQGSGQSGSTPESGGSGSSEASPSQSTPPQESAPSGQAPSQPGESSASRPSPGTGGAPEAPVVSGGS
jgi:hypothetical protein